MVIVRMAITSFGHLRHIGKGHQRSASSIIELSAMLSFYTSY
jgi:hypothetical protein